MSHQCNRHSRSMTAQYIKTLLCSCSLKTRPLVIGGGKNILPEKLHHSWVICCRKYTVSAPPKSHKIGKTRLRSQCQRLQIKLRVGAKHRTRIKNLLKTYFQKKGDSLWTLSRKDWNTPPYFSPRKYDHNQINNTATQQPWKMEVFKCLIRKTKAKILLRKLLKTSFCAAHTAITKCTPLKPTQSQEHQPGKMH